MSTGPDFVGAKLALFHKSAVLTLLRDDFPGLPWPGHWDLPGGGREGDETPEDCALRELQEEFGLQLPPERLLWRSVHPSAQPVGSIAHFFAGRITAAEIAAIRFGNEGQEWRMMPATSYLAHPRAVPFLRDRLAGCLQANPAFNR